MDDREIDPHETEEASAHEVEQPTQTHLRRLWDRFGYLVVTMLVTLAIFGVLLLPAYVPSGSMEPTMPTRSFFLALRLPYLLGDPLPKRQDITVFYSVEMAEIMVKRVIGLPGDTILIQDGIVHVNGTALEEPYLPMDTYTQSDSGRELFQVPEACIFLLGDNRETSYDSRYWAESFIPLSQLKGQALVNISLLPGTTWKGVRLLF